MNMVRLEEACEVIAGQSPPSEFYNTEGIGLPFFQGKADFGDLYPRVRIWCSKPQKVAERGDILISVRAPVGPTNIAQERSCIGRGLAAIRPGIDVDTKYLLNYLRFVEPKLSQIGHGSTFAAITVGELRSVEIPLPPLPEQRRIAAVLDAADALRAKRRAALARLDDLLQSVFLDMFGDPVTNPKGWAFRPLSSCFARERDGTKCGPFGSALRRNEYLQSGIPVWTMDSIRGIEFDPAKALFISERKYLDLEAYSTLAGDVIISRAGTVGKMCVVDTDEPRSIISTNLIRLSLDQDILDPYFFVSLMTFAKGRIGRLQTGADGAYSFMNTGILKTLRIVVPPISMQRQYRTFWFRRNEQVRLLNAGLRLSENLFFSLQQHFFRENLQGLRVP